mgnify:CR=1 FL=1
MTTDLADDFFYDNVVVSCPRCDSHAVAFYSFTNDDGEHVREGRCADCQSSWYVD